MNTPICSVGTTITLSSVETVILVFEQDLWLGNHMDRSLINTNKQRACGISVYDNIMDGH